MIVFDAEHLRKPYMGFYTFVDFLGKALAQEARNRGVRMGFYVPEDKVGYFGDDMEYFIFKKYHQYFMHLPKHVTLFHSARQRSHYLPTLSKAKILTTVHDLNYLYSKRKSIHPKYHFFYQRSINHADRLVAISEFAKKDTIEHLNLKGKEISVIYNGIGAPADPIKPKYIPQGKFLFAVATVLPKKNFHVLPCLLEGNDYELIIAGRDSNKEYIQKVIDEARKYGVENRLHIIGPCDEGVKTWYMKHCEAFLFPSISEGFGLPIIEAMCFGKPLFVSAHTCIPEIAGDMAYYFNYEFDRKKMQQEFRDGMKDFLNGGKTAEQIIAHAHSYDWNKAAKEYFDVYSEMLDGKLD